MASTETAIMVQHTTDREDWQYICLNPEYNGIEMRPTGDLYELVFIKDEAHTAFQGVFRVYPSLTEYAMADLYSKHPTKPYHWKFEGRKDDIIVSRSGWNFNPTIHEHLITSHTAVQNCILVGAGRDWLVAVIEMRSEFYTEEEEGKMYILELLWPKIKEANELADSTGQLRRDCIMFAKKEKPFAIAGKGTVQRKATMKMYKDEIDELYKSIDTEGGSKA
jgi:hypothetical protein